MGPKVVIYAFRGGDNIKYLRNGWIEFTHERIQLPFLVKRGYELQGIIQSVGVETTSLQLHGT
jgi:hypothetical protein